MKIILIDTNQQMVDAARHFHIEAYCEPVFTRVADAIVSPANSFGFMDGGIDQIYTNYFGPGIQAQLQERIKTDYYGEVLVGQAVAIPTGRHDYAFVISAPTMRVPKRIVDENAIYLATKAAVRSAARALMGMHNPVLIIPGMGTGAGGVDTMVSAMQMTGGIRDALKPPAFPKSWHEAYKRQYNPHIEPKDMR